MWEDIDQPESEVAKALHLDLAELRALRTPVPVRPAGMPEMRGDGEIPRAIDSDLDDEPQPTTPVPRMRTAEVFGDDDVPELPQDDSVEVDVHTPKPAPLPTNPVPIRPHDIVVSVGSVPSPVIDKPSIGAAYLARSHAPSRMPWIIVGALVMVVLTLMAYILLK